MQARERPRLRARRDRWRRHPFPCGFETCWSKSQFCSFATGGARFDKGVCAPLPCTCGARPTCACVPSVGGACTCAADDGGAMLRTCTYP